MTSEVLRVDGVGKCYTSYRSNLERFATWFGLPARPISEHWAVRDVSFGLNQGDALALIGQNGAGKSTLLKMITGTVRATRGRVAVAGRVSAILELGLGFNPEFTGRQNIYQAGGLMGFANSVLTRLMPEIEAFAELGSFFDEPLRIYSSGMQARLAFSLVTAVRPELLIVDEVLSVGDSYFQHKSFDRIRQFKSEGTAILFVSHSMGDVRALCDRVLLLDKGRVIREGPPDEVVDYYNVLMTEKENALLSLEQRREKDGWSYTRSGTFEVVATGLRLCDAASGEPVTTALVGQDLVLTLHAEARTDIHRLVLGFMLRDRTGHVVWGTNTWHTKQVLETVKAGETIRFDLRFPCDLGPGSYAFSPALSSSDTHLDDNYEWQDNALVFDVVNARFPNFIGTSHLVAEFSINRGDS